MPDRREGPVRTCVGCRRTAPRERLVRFASVEGSVVPDPEARAPGRGAWLHPDRGCLERAIARRGFQRAFRAPVIVPPDTVDCFPEWPKSASES